MLSHKIRNIKCASVPATSAFANIGIGNNRFLNVSIARNTKARAFNIDLPFTRNANETTTPVTIEAPVAKSSTKTKVSDIEVKEAPSIYIDPLTGIFGSFVLLYILMVIRQGNNISKFTNVDKQATTTDVTFDDLAGLDNAKRDVYEIVEFLKNPEKFSKVGARIPRGVLLTGPPGCGKTMLAKAVANEADVPFFYCSASEMIQMFVGVGAARIRSIFEKAKKKTPSIIFIDEIDAIGKSRRMSPIGSPGNDEQEQTINQLLTEMDGFEGNSGVIVIGATNRPDILDDALLRPGRFDRTIYITLPTLEERVEIIKKYFKHKKVDKSFDSSVLAKTTAGFSSADLENLINEAAILCARQDMEVITQEHFFDALDKLTIGELGSKTMSEEQRISVAFHEAGHVVAAMYTELFENIRTVSIIPRGQTGGVTIFEPKEHDVDNALYTRDYLEKQMVIALGGRAAEELTFGPSQVTTGASGDFRVVEDIARAMVTSYGFDYNYNESPQMSWTPELASSALISRLENSMSLIVRDMYQNTKNILLKNEDLLNEIASELIDKEVLNSEDLKQYYDRVIK